jgi:Tfp pilus assembly protein PilE
MKNKGITLTSLVITIIVMLILAGVTITAGYSVVKKSKLETLKTNMLLIQAKTKTALEEYNFSKDETKLIGTKVTENEEIKQKLEATGATGEIDDWYYLQKTDLEQMSLSDITPENGEYYLVKYDKESLETEILYTKGYTNGNQTKYTLTDLQNME